MEIIFSLPPEGAHCSRQSKVLDSPRCLSSFIHPRHPFLSPPFFMLSEHRNQSCCNHRPSTRSGMACERRKNLPGSESMANRENWITRSNIVVVVCPSIQKMCPSCSHVVATCQTSIKTNMEKLSPKQNCRICGRCSSFS